MRVVLGVGLIWGILWLAVATAVGTYIWFFDPDSIDPEEEHLALVVGLVGFIIGVVFGSLLAKKDCLDAPPTLVGTRLYVRTRTTIMALELGPNR
jgi:hypothetical protein